MRTRFAPSPTGYLHIGGARTALFNYLLAKRLGGRFVVRIEDTDQTRNIEAADRKLFADLRWLGLSWDEGPEVGGEHGPYYQSQRLQLYTDHARRLLDDGRAYYALETSEELEAMRREAMQRGEKGFRYPRPKSFPAETEARKARDEGRPVVIRFKMPERDFVVNDRILGEVQIAASELSDFVIVKADGWPTYHFAVVIDDADMRITHVLRGQEHLMNTPNHLALQEAFGYPTPAYAHLPIIFTMKGGKMSKREKDKVVREAAKAVRLDQRRLMEMAGLADAEAFTAWQQGKTQLEADNLRRLANALAVTLPEIDIHDFRVSGYLPEVLVNFIALLGWSAGDDREKYTLEELCAAFSIERVTKKNARFDREKLLSFNTTALAEARAERKLAAFHDYLGVNEPGPFSNLDDALLTRVMEMCEGFRTFPDLELKCGKLFIPDEAVQYDPKAVKKWLLKGENRGLKVLTEMSRRLAALDDWSGPELDKLIRGYAEEHELGLGKVAQPLRVAVTGTTISPQIFDTLALLGKERTLTRIGRALETVTPPSA
ncbi:MAG: glutamate--tRNA ligase [Phycisphaerae bacterium]|nr:glutamate--tRNA ligase [Phycisphaerae bacterium]